MAETSVITKARRVALCKLTSGAITTMPAITHIAFGDGGVDGNGNPLTPADTQTTLKREVARYPINAQDDAEHPGLSYPVDTTARYTVTIPKEDLAGEKISEAALVDAAGALAAIKTMYVKQKDEGVSFTFTFDDEF